MGAMRGVLLMLALTLAHAKWALVYYPNFDVSQPKCQVDGVQGMFITYPELSCGALSKECSPERCINACTGDENCLSVVVEVELRRCQFRCKEDVLVFGEEGYVPREGYSTFMLTSEATMTALDMDVDYIIVDSSPNMWATWMIRVAACLFIFSLVIFYCTDACTIAKGTNTPFGFAPKDQDKYNRLDEEAGFNVSSPKRTSLREPASPNSAAKIAAVKAREEAKAAAAAAKAAALRAKEEAEAKAKVVADKKAKAEAEAKAKAMREADMKVQTDAEAKAKAMKEAAKAEADAKAKAKAAADARAKAEADAKAQAKAEADARAKADAAAKAKAKAAADAKEKADAAAKAKADAKAKAEAEAKAKAKAEADAIKEAEAKLKAAMPYPFKYAEPAKLQPAIEAAKKVAGVSQVAIDAAQAKLDEALAATAAADKAKKSSEMTMTAAGLLDNDKGRDKLVQDRFEQADDDNSGTLDTDEVIGLIGTL